MTWHIVLTAPQCEKSAKRLLDQLGHETRVPMRTRKRRMKRYSRKLQTFREPILKGYIFARFCGWRIVSTERVSENLYMDRRRQDELLIGVQDASCIRRIMRHPAGRPVLLTDKQLQHLLNLANDECALDGEQNHFHIGKEVILAAGPFANYRGRIKDFPRPGRALIDFSEWGQFGKVELEISELEAA